MTAHPLGEILQTERLVAAAITGANDEAAAALAEARRRAKQLVAEAFARGQATAERRFEVGLTRARDEADHIRSGADDRVATLRRQAEPYLSSAVDLVIDTVLPHIEEG